MGISTIDAGMLKNAFLAGAKGLEAKNDYFFKNLFVLFLCNKEIYFQF